MHVNCPNCQRSYELIPSKMPAPKFNGVYDSWGWKFECGQCDTQWWLKLTYASATTNSDAHENHSDCIQPTPPCQHDDTIVDPRVLKFAHENKSSNLLRRNHTKITNLPVLAPQSTSAEKKTRLTPPPLRIHDINQFYPRKKHEPAKGIWTFIFLLILILSIIIYNYQDVFLNKLNYVLSSNSAQSTAMTLPLNVQHVQWETKELPDGRTNIIVMGEVINANQSLSNLRPLRLLAWGACDSDEKSDKRCILASWEYAFPKPTIVPAERISFQTSWVLDKSRKLISVDATLP